MPPKSLSKVPITSPYSHVSPYHVLTFLTSSPVCYRCSCWMEGRKQIKSNQILPKCSAEAAPHGGCGASPRADPAGCCAGSALGRHRLGTRYWTISEPSPQAAVRIECINSCKIFRIAPGSHSVCNA